MEQPHVSPSSPERKALRPLPRPPRSRADTASDLQAIRSTESLLSVEADSSKERRHSADGADEADKRPAPPRPLRAQAQYLPDLPEGSSASPLSNHQARLVSVTSQKRTLHLKELLLEPAPEAETVQEKDAMNSEEELAKRLRHRKELVIEILATERAYVGDLAAVIKLYIRPLESTRKELLSPQERLSIFSNIESILPLNERLLAELEAEAAKPLAERRIGGCFLQLVEYLKMYQVYCGNQGESLALLAKLKKRRKEWVAFCETVRQQPEFRKLGLEDLLIKPMQRLCRYPLLITELAKLTPEEHSDRKALLAVKERLDQVIQIANEAKRLFDATVVLRKLHKHLLLTTDPSFILIIPSRVLVRRTTLKLWSHKIAGKERVPSSSKREVLLFNDIIMICEARDKKLTERALYPVKEVIAWELKGDRYANSLGIVRTDSPDTMSFACDSAEERDQWIQLILGAAAVQRAKEM